ncbi:MAG: helix-turn-helix transcriptional regulator [Candidatus Nitronauta litoralis]|uniref:Helix-turn-helix transcriptional regulator n=1 Tax=Candidatus Nitronauta litoralis TaxID=2705533 RepID=A0A7T0BVD4_9BACT|nr:MAG: helix-turn-helix transcriptional regulator [Candidatus Nitronauta litoralis]
MTFKECWLRVTSATPIAKYNQLAEALGIHPSSVHGAKKRDMFPAKWAFVIGEKYGISPEWIITGKDPQNAIEEGVENYKLGESSEFIRVPRYDVSVSAGHGSVIHSEQIVDYLSFKRDWVASRELNPKSLVLVKVDGDSMTPTLLDGDLILVNRGVQEYRSDGLYVLNFDGNLQVKRIQKMPTGDLIIQGDNPAYKAFTAVGDQVELLTIIGRVVWFARDI